MTDVPNEAPAADEPQVSAPESGTSANGFDAPVSISDVPEELRGYAESLEKQFKGQYTKKTQELAEQVKFVEQLRSDEEVQRRVFQTLAEHLGYDLDFDNEDDLEALLAEEDDEPFRDPRVDELLAEREREQEAAQKEAFFEQIDAHSEQEYSQIGQEVGRSLNEDEKDLLLALALSLPPRTDQLPDIKAAHAQLQQYVASEMERYIQTKTATRAPKGVPGAEKFDVTDEKQRIDRITAIVASHQAGQ